MLLLLLSVEHKFIVHIYIYQPMYDVAPYLYIYIYIYHIYIYTYIYVYQFNNNYCDASLEQSIEL